MGGVILRNYSRHEFDVGPYRFDEVAIGADWGYNHATALLLLGFKDGDIYICDEIYLKEKMQTEIIDVAKKADWPRHVFMWCDSAEPETIKQWRYAGFRSRPVEKEQRSIQAQIRWLQDRKIYIHPRCENTYREIQNWQWRANVRTGEFEDEPATGEDDAMAALRYGIEGWRKSRRHNVREVSA